MTLGDTDREALVCLEPGYLEWGQWGWRVQDRPWGCLWGTAVTQGWPNFILTLLLLLCPVWRTCQLLPTTWELAATNHTPWVLCCYALVQQYVDDCERCHLHRWLQRDGQWWHTAHNHPQVRATPWELIEHTLWIFQPPWKVQLNCI